MDGLAPEVKLLITTATQCHIISKLPSVLVFCADEMLMTKKDVLRSPGVKVMNDVKN